MSDLSSSEDEVLVTTNIDPSQSPIHYLKSSIEENNTIIRISSFDESNAEQIPLQPCSLQQQQQQQPLQQQQQSLTPTVIFKNSKTRRSEYSVKGLRLGDSNTSQDSAFSSMTEQNSFQSISSPIDEGCEDILHRFSEADLLNIDGSNVKTTSCSSPSSDINLRDLDIPGPSNLYFSSHQNPQRSYNSNIKETCIYLEPPKLKINNENYNQPSSSSPTRKSSSETFSKKYRVLSFEDIKKPKLDKKPYRSFEEEQRLLGSSSPITSLTDSEQIDKKKIPSERNSSLSGKERSVLWKDSFLKHNKNNLTIKSNESIYFDDDYQSSEYQESDHLIQSEQENSASDLQTISSEIQNTRKRFLFGLAKFKQKAIGDSIQLSNSSTSKSSTSNENNSKSSSAESKLDQTISTSQSISDDEDILTPLTPSIENDEML